MFSTIITGALRFYHNLTVIKKRLWFVYLFIYFLPQTQIVVIQLTVNAAFPIHFQWEQLQQRQSTLPLSFLFGFCIRNCKRLAAAHDRHTCGSEWYIKLKVLRSLMECVSSNQNARSGLTDHSTSYSETLTHTLKMTRTGMEVFHASIKIFKRLR